MNIKIFIINFIFMSILLMLAMDSISENIFIYLLFLGFLVAISVFNYVNGLNDGIKIKQEG